jgi:hypothetical protein
MSLLEWLGERRSPGPLGTVESGPPEPGNWHPGFIVVCGVIAAAMLSGAIGWLFSVIDSRGDFALSVFLVALYCALGYWINPRPDYSNVGLLGGVVDHPFKWSDDYNRWLVFLRILLWPGRFISVSLRDVVLVARGRRTLVLPPRDDRER